MLLVLVFLYPLVSPGLLLTCYVCSSSPTNDECNASTQECQAPLDTCMTTVDTLGNMKAIVKQCASRATCNGAASSAFVDSDGNGNAVSCCNSFNLCNFSGGESIHAQGVFPMLLLVTAGTLLWSN
ncbi:urokinase plasminogen activator surface receptor-like [Syngnathus typhle]|uniref:urokinase plasminogen activator surface receptor-like n=1 Tax=Syngnathus typhle TaxID=161592 RepID=UPI002A69EB4C|nr:urokinase plasminogen activator surface receptor-like [Syngnathus typhle]